MLKQKTLKTVGATRVGMWRIKHLVAPLDRWLYRRTNGRFLTLGRPLAPTLLLTTTGRKSGQPRTTPVFYWRDSEKENMMPLQLTTDQVWKEIEQNLFVVLGIPLMQMRFPDKARGRAAVTTTA